jgi:poly(hydroxyalkanoate) depolymerase family esterase
MKNDFAQALNRALLQTRASDLAGATRTIQSALGVSHPTPSDGPDLRSPTAPQDEARRPASPRRSLRDVIEVLARGPGRRPAGRSTGGTGKLPTIAEGARYERRHFSSDAGAREHTLYVPSRMQDGPQGLILMLHGCTQDADDFACGTGMNAIAERHGLIVAYPEQPRAQNPMACWNWFRPSDQQAGRGEPRILADLAQSLTREFGVDPDRVFAAGLSAGGALAAILGVTHPDIFRAIGVHSGLPHGAASDVASAYAAMRQDPGPGAGLHVPAIVFHGSADGTVNPANGERIFRAAALGAVTEAQGSTAGRSWTCHRAEAAEFWRIDGAGHAWSGGSPSGSYTDQAGPDASAEMVRFFLASTARGES